MEASGAAGEDHGNVVSTRAPARPDRLPWSRFHWRVVIGLGTVWVLDGLEVTIVGSIASRLTEKGSGLELTAGQVGTAAAIYVAGACIGALIFGQLTDRFGRKRLFLLTLALYITATLVTAFSFTALFFYVARFFTGAGIGGEYAAINSAIDELIPARVRGRIDLIINGSYWAGAAAGAGAALFLLTDTFAKDIGWRLAFGIGAILGIAVLFVRRHVPESPRWLTIHEREDEANEILDDIEQRVERETGQELPPAEDEMQIRQRRRVPLTAIARTLFRDYPKRTTLGLCLFVGQAFLYNAITFDLGTLFSKFFNVASGTVPIYFVIFAIGNFLGPVLLGHFFDTVGRRVMVTATYAIAAVGGVILAVLIDHSSISSWGFLAVICATFFIASAGASSAYLTVSEIFPIETRALSIALFYAIGTAIGGISGPLLFGHLIAFGSTGKVAFGFYIGAALMLVGAFAELLFGPAAEQQQLEDIARPLSQVDGEESDRKSSGARPAHRLRDHRFGPAAPASRLGSGSEHSDPALAKEIEIIHAALIQDGPLVTRELYRATGARYWGPGRFRQALRKAMREGEVMRESRRGRYRVE